MKEALTEMNLRNRAAWHNDPSNRKIKFFVHQLIKQAVPCPDAQVKAALSHRRSTDAKIAEIRSLIRDEKIRQDFGRKLIFILKKNSRDIDENFFA
jgi:hypothetical protein